MNKLKKRMELREKVLHYLAENTSLDIDTTIMDQQLAEIFAESVEEVYSVLIALEADGLIRITFESNMGLGAIISSDGQKLVHYGPQHDMSSIHNHFYAAVHAVQQGTDSVLNLHLTNKSEVSESIRHLRNVTSGRTDSIRGLIADQLLDLQAEIHEQSPKGSRIFSALTTLLALAGDDQEVVALVSRLGQLLEVKFPSE